MKAAATAYKPRVHVNTVLQSSKATHSARHVLMCLCHEAEWDRPEVTITKLQIAEFTRLSHLTVRRALRILKDEGVITQIRNQQGGRGKAPTYRLIAVGQGGDTPDDGGGGGESNSAPAVFAQILARYSVIDPAGYEQWVKSLSFERVEGDILILRAASRYKASHVQTHLAERIATVAANYAPEVAKVKVEAA